MVDLRALLEPDAVAVRAALHEHHVHVAGRDEDLAALERFAIHSLADFEFGKFVEPLGESGAVAGGDVLNDADGREIRGQDGEDVLKRLGAAGGGADENDLAGAGIVDGGGVDAERGGRCRAGDAGRAGGGFDFRDEFAREVGAEGSPRGFGEDIHRAGFEGLQGVLGALCTQGAENHGRHGVLSGEDFQEGDAIHFRHLNIESQNIRLELQDHVPGFVGVGSGANHFDRGIGRESIRNKPPENRGVVHNQNAGFPKAHADFLKAQHHGPQIRRPAPRES